MKKAERKKPSGVTVLDESAAGLNPPLVILGAVGIYFLAQIIGINLVALYGAVQGWSLEHIEDWLTGSLLARFAVYMVVSALGVAMVGLVLRLRRVSWAAIGLKRPELKHVLYAIGGYAIYLPIYVVTVAIASELSPAVDLKQNQQLGFSTALTGASLIFVFVSLVILPALYEEILVRGMLFTGLRTKLTVPLAALVTSLLFAVAHLQLGSGKPPLWTAAIDTFVLSMALIYLRQKTGSLWPAIGLHAIKNTTAFTLLFILKV